VLRRSASEGGRSRRIQNGYKTWIQRLRSATRIITEKSRISEFAGRLLTLAEYILTMIVYLFPCVLEVKMKRTLVMSILMLLAFAAVSVADTPREGFVPTWKAGDRWVLEASYRDLKAEGEVWLPPIQWVFRVRSIKEKYGRQCYIVHVFPRHGEMKVQAILWLAVEDLKPVRVIDVFPTPEGMRYSERDLDPENSEPLVAVDTLVPYDLPVFPLANPANNAVQGADGFAAYRSEATEKKFSRTSKVGSLSFKRTFGQKNKKPERQYSDTFAAYRSSGATYQVEVAEERSSTNLLQLWQEGSPWAVSSENRLRKVRLVPASELPGASSQTGGDE